MISKALLTDLYQFTMMQGLFKEGLHRTPCVFDRFYRKNPFDGAYTVVAGLEHVIDYLKICPSTKMILPIYVKPVYLKKIFSTI